MCTNPRYGSISFICSGCLRQRWDDVISDIMLPEALSMICVNRRVNIHLRPRFVFFFRPSWLLFCERHLWVSSLRNCLDEMALPRTADGVIQGWIAIVEKEERIFMKCTPSLPVAIHQKDLGWRLQQLFAGSYVWHGWTSLVPDAFDSCRDALGGYKIAFHVEAGCSDCTWSWEILWKDGCLYYIYLGYPFQVHESTLNAPLALRWNSVAPLVFFLKENVQMYIFVLSLGVVCQSVVVWVGLFHGSFPAFSLPRIDSFADCWLCYAALQLSSCLHQHLSLSCDHLFRPKLRNIKF